MSKIINLITKKWIRRISVLVLFIFIVSALYEWVSVNQKVITETVEAIRNYLMSYKEPDVIIGVILLPVLVIGMWNTIDYVQQFKKHIRKKRLMNPRR